MTRSLMRTTQTTGTRSAPSRWPTSFRENTLGPLRTLEVPLRPLDQQHRIAAHLDQLQIQVDMLKHEQANTAAELDALLPSVLDKAFRGEL